MPDNRQPAVEVNVWRRLEAAGFCLPPLSARQRLAVLDIGSNSVRLVVFAAGRYYRPILVNSKVTCALARTLADSGALNPEGVVRLYEVLPRFCRIIKDWDCEAVVLGTAALREARDGPLAVQMISENLGVPVQVVSGQTEALLAAAAMLQAYGAAGCERMLAVDLGGGSIELAMLKTARQVETLSLPFGTLRGSTLRQAEAALAGSAFLPQSVRMVVVMGGALRQLGKLAMRAHGRKGLALSGYVDSIGFWRQFLAEIRHCSPTALRARGASASRAPSLAYAAGILSAVLARCDAPAVRVTTWSIREAVAYRSMPVRPSYLCRRLQEIFPVFLERRQRDVLTTCLSGYCFNAPDPESVAAAVGLSNVAAPFHDKGASAVAAVLSYNLPELSHQQTIWLALAIAARYDARPAVVHQRLLSAEQQDGAVLLGRVLRSAWRESRGDFQWLASRRLQLPDQPRPEEQTASGAVSIRFVEQRTAR